MMLLMALAVAVLVVIIAATVVTGGAALIAIGAIAGAAGAAIGAVAGALFCGQKAAGLRSWSSNKPDMIVQGTKVITGGHQMTCKAGGIVTFAPQIKSWSQAIAVGAGNYISGIMEGMMAGACVGMAGAAVVGGGSAVAAGGARGLGQAALSFVRSMPKNFVVNIAESFSKFGLALRGTMAAQNTAATYGKTGQAGAGDVVKGFFGMEIGAWDSAKNIFTGKAGWQDWAGVALAFAPVGKGKRDLEDMMSKKADEAGGGNKDGEAATKARSAEGEQGGKVKDGNAYASSRLKPINADPPFKPGEGHSITEFEKQIKAQQDGMNNLTVDEFIQNRDAYLKKLADEKAAGVKDPSGRSTEGSKAQEAYRKEAIRQKSEELRNADPNLSRKDALEQAKEYYSDKAALHDPDQVAGGHGTNITGMGESNVNSSIGSQWKTRIDGIDAQVREQAKSMTPEEMRNTKLNVHLYP